MTAEKPWLTEPNECDFIDDATGLPVALRRQPKLKHWCGYVGVPDGHPWHGKSYNDVDADCHGGLTYSGEGYWDDTRASHWFGFDCAHAGDLVPGFDLAIGAARLMGASFSQRPDRGEVYRDIGYAKASASQLAASIACTRGEKDWS